VWSFEEINDEIEHQLVHKNELGCKNNLILFDRKEFKLLI